ncbi:MAG TPA: YbhB/YbcL family Raf kinase inhibitor-like protein [Burkholderiales bacterium]|nr:YbhB/YbcL family Raf kinase inhibitor-like protein [Burkholderiales bacterium]
MQTTMAQGQAGGTAHAAEAAFRLSSPVLRDGETIGNAHLYNGMDCTGHNVSPALQWQGAPQGTKSFAVTIYNPDAPTGSGWWHWVVYDIPAGVTALPAGAGASAQNPLPEGARQANTEFGRPGYGGPCPPRGDKPHRYIFTVHALAVEKLDVPPDATAAFVGFNIHANRLGSATLTGMYGR